MLHNTQLLTKILVQTKLSTYLSLTAIQQSKQGYSVCLCQAIIMYVEYICVVIIKKYIHALTYHWNGQCNVHIQVSLEHGPQKVAPHNFHCTGAHELKFPLGPRDV